jgi:hypothetical protein
MDVEGIVKILQDRIKEIMLVEGEIERFSQIGNSISIKFKSGKFYTQNMISKNTKFVNVP